MDLLTRLLAFCGSSLHLIAGEPAGLPLALFLAGLAGSLVHCAGMCGPFVLSQVMADATSTDDKSYGEWHRLAGAALVPYHLGRLTTYTLLGALAGAATMVVASTEFFGWLSAFLLVVAAGLLLAQAFGLMRGAGSPSTGIVTRLAARLSASTSPFARYALGVILGFLPCGLVYAALAAAAGTASPLDGAFALSAFALGTMPALVLIGWGGLIVRRRLRSAARWIAAPLLTGNALILLVLAGQRL
jgi:sulfite exporter TauE/SafE